MGVLTSPRALFSTDSGSRRRKLRMKEEGSKLPTGSNVRWCTGDNPCPAPTAPGEEPSVGLGLGTLPQGPLGHFHGVGALPGALQPLAHPFILAVHEITHRR